MAPLAAGIDYNLRRLDVATIRGRELVTLTSYDLGRDLAVQINVMARCVEELRAASVELVVMEKPWMREGRGMGSAMELHKVPTRVETLAVFAGLKVRYVPVNTWHREILGNGGLKSVEAKQASVRYVEMVYKRRIDSADAADAVCLATWAAGALKAVAV